MTCGIVAFTRRGAALGTRLARALGGTLHVSPAVAEGTGAAPYGTLPDWVAQRWTQGQALIFVGAVGIAVRAIAPYVQDKFTDPAVVCVDEAGRFSVALLSGHVGGANALASQIAALTGGTAVISTATDVNGLFAVDVWARERGLTITDRQAAKAVSAALLEGKPVGFVSDFPVEGELPQGLTARDGVRPKIHLTCRDYREPAVLRLVPRCLVLGIGCRRGMGEEDIARAVEEALRRRELDAAAVMEVATIDQKAEEAGLQAYCRRRELPLRTYPAQVLARVPGVFTASAFVQSVVGVDNVCERAALAGGGTLLLGKQAGNGVTVAVALRTPVLNLEEGKETP